MEHYSVSYWTPSLRWKSTNMQQPVQNWALAMDESRHLSSAFTMQFSHLSGPSNLKKRDTSCAYDGASKLSTAFMRFTLVFATAFLSRCICSHSIFSDILIRHGLRCHNFLSHRSCSHFMVQLQVLQSWKRLWLKICGWKGPGTHSTLGQSTDALNYDHQFVQVFSLT